MTEENKMEYVRLGKSGLKISRLILGCASYGLKANRAWLLEEAEALQHIKLAYDLGINAFDTANVYSNGICNVSFSSLSHCDGLIFYLTTGI